MIKKQQNTYTKRDQKAEKEIDDFLRQINAGGASDIMNELRQATLN